MHDISEDTLKAAYTTAYAGLIGYAMAVGEKIGREEALRILARLHAGMAEMVKEHLPQLGIQGNDARAGAQLLYTVMRQHNPGMMEMMELRRVVDTPEQVVTQHSGYCAALEACKMLGIPARDFCPIPHEEGLTPIVQVVNPNLRVRLGKIRPEADYCELIVELKK